MSKPIPKSSEVLRKFRISIVKIEDRPRDAWIDMSLRQLREGEVRFYRVKDFSTGEWLFKVCPDAEKNRTIVKALKCPPGKSFAQLEGSTMLFQKSILENLYYDVISLSYIDDDGRLRRNMVESIEEIPNVLHENFEIKSYEEATGRKAPGKKLVTLCRWDDEKAMIMLFLTERAWPVSQIPPEIGMKTPDIYSVIKKLERVKIDEVYRVASEKFGLTHEDLTFLLDSLERDGKILRPQDGYVKTKR